MMLLPKFFLASKVFFIHFFASLLLLLLIAFFVFEVWFPYPFFYLASSFYIFSLLFSVDVVCGPLLSALIFNPRKSKKELFLDFSVIFLLQISLLVYGIYVIGTARPVAVVFEKDRFVVVSAGEVAIDRLYKAQPEWQKMPWSGPRFLVAKDATNDSELVESLDLTMQGVSPGYRPDWWISYDKNREKIAKVMKPMSALVENKNNNFEFKLKSSFKDYERDFSKIYYLPLVNARNLDEWSVVLNKNADVVGYAKINGFK